MKSIVILGSTGSIGVNTLKLVRKFPDHFKVRGLVAGKNIGRLIKQIEYFSPDWVSVEEKSGMEKLHKRLSRRKIRLLWGQDGATVIASAPEVDTVVAAIVGSAGLAPTLGAVRAGKEVCLANKESLVMAGEVFTREAKKRSVRLLPVDSEHSAIFQCLQGNRREEVERIILTASGGPFLHTPLSKLNRVTVDQALKHPNWKMGQKITVDSATMMNKGLEVLEAKWLFGLSPSQVDVVIHPQSIVHSMVRYQDGAVLAQMGIPDMRIPIAYALSCPYRLRINLRPLELTKIQNLTFFPVERNRYPSLYLAYQALSSGGTMPAVLNSANEVAVGAFLNRQIGFRAIHQVIERTMESHSCSRARNLHEIIEADRWARERATWNVARV